MDNRAFDDRTQDDVFYFLYNNFQDTLIAMLQSVSFFVKELFQRTAGIGQGNQIVFYLSIGCVVVSVLGLIPVVHIVNKTKQRYLEVFLELDNNNIRKLSTKCEKYMNMVQDESNEDINSNDDELEEMARAQAEDAEEEYSMSSSGRRAKKKRSKNTISNKRMFVIKFIIGMLIIEIYFFANFFVQSSFLQTCQILGGELNMTASVESFFWFAQNAQREVYSEANLTVKKPILLRDSFQVAKETIVMVQHVGSDLQQLHLQNQGYAASTYNTLFSKTMLDSVCSIVDTSFQNYTGGKTCDKFISGSTTQGLHTVIVRYEEGLRKVLSNFLKTNNSVETLNSEDLLDLFNI